MRSARNRACLHLPVVGHPGGGFPVVFEAGAFFNSSIVAFITRYHLLLFLLDAKRRVSLRCYRRAFRNSGSLCRILPMSAHAFIREPRGKIEQRKLVAALVRASSSQVTGAETGAPGRARVEYGAIDVASREFRK